MLIDDTGDLVEIWNLVFIQYNRDDTGALQPLPEKHVDTGMGFERMCSLLQGAESNYETDVFQPLIGRIAELTGKECGREHRVPMQVVADHVPRPQLRPWPMAQCPPTRAVGTSCAASCAAPRATLASSISTPPSFIS